MGIDCAFMSNKCDSGIIFPSMKEAGKLIYPCLISKAVKNVTSLFKFIDEKRFNINHVRALETFLENILVLRKQINHDTPL